MLCARHASDLVFASHQTDLQIGGIFVKAVSKSILCCETESTLRKRSAPA
jgi:hypothetical protein